MARKNVSASEVRMWANENIALIPEAGHLCLTGKNGVIRGRLHPEVIAAFRKANKGKDYITGSDAEKPTVTVKVQAQDKAGRNITRKVTLLTSEARTLLGQVDKKGKSQKGRFNEAALTAAVQAREDAAAAAPLAEAV